MNFDEFCHLLLDLDNKRKDPLNVETPETLKAMVMSSRHHALPFMPTASFFFASFFFVRFSHFHIRLIHTHSHIFILDGLFGPPLHTILPLD